MSTFIRTCVLIFAASLALSGCATQVSYFAGSDHEMISPANIAKTAPMPVRVEVAFSRNGQRVLDADRVLKREVIRALGETTVLRAVDDPEAGAVLKVIVNDIVDPADNAGTSYFVAGLTFGGVGASHITDRYEFTLSYVTDSGQERFALDKHAIWTHVGGKPPASLRGPFATPEGAFQMVVADATLGFLNNIANNTGTPGSLLFTPQDQQQSEIDGLPADASRIRVVLDR